MVATEKNPITSEDSFREEKCKSKFVYEFVFTNQLNSFTPSKNLLNSVALTETTKARGSSFPCPSQGRLSMFCSEQQNLIALSYEGFKQCLVTYCFRPGKVKHRLCYVPAIGQSPAPFKVTSNTKL